MARDDIQGRVELPDGTTTSGVTVTALNETDGWLFSTETASDGTYSIDYHDVRGRGRWHVVAQYNDGTQYHCYTKPFIDARLPAEGRFMYVTDFDTGQFIQYELGVPHDTTSTVLSTNIDSGPGGNLEDMVWGPDGEVLFSAEGSSDVLVKYEASTRWDITSLTEVANQSLSHRADSITLDDTGTSFYIIDRANDIVYRYTVDEAYTFTGFSEAATYTFLHTVSGFDWNTDGSAAYVRDDDTLYEYTTVDPFGLSSLSQTDSTSVRGGFNNGHGVAFSPDGLKMFGCDSQSSSIRVNEYHMDSPFDLGTHSHANMFETNDGGYARGVEFCSMPQYDG